MSWIGFLSLLAVVPAYYTGYKHGWRARGEQHWRTFNRLVDATRDQMGVGR